MFKIYCFATCMLFPVMFFAQLSQKLDSALQPVLNNPGYALLIEQNGKILYQKQDGLASLLTGKKIGAGSNFRMASVTKQFTAMGVLLLQKEHRLFITDPIGKYLPELPAHIGRTVLIKHLLTHSSGLLDYESLIPLGQTKQVLDADVLRLLKDQDSTYFTPGTQFRYSNSGFCLLSLIIERIAHQSFSSFIKQKIFMPLHMSNSIVYREGVPVANRVMGYAKDSTGKIVFSDQSVTSATKGDGGVYTSIKDYQKWLHALQQNTLLTLADAMQKIRFPVKPSSADYYAAGWFQTGQRQQVLFHPGSTCGFNNYVIEVPARKFSIIYFSNLADNLAAFKAIVAVIKQSGLGDFSQVFGLFDLTN